MLLVSRRRPRAVCPLTVNIAARKVQTHTTTGAQTWFTLFFLCWRMTHNTNIYHPEVVPTGLDNNVCQVR